MDRDIVDRLEDYGQAHVLAFWGDLDFSQRQTLLQQISQVDLALVERTFRRGPEQGSTPADACRAEPPPTATDFLVDSARRDAAIAAGLAAMAAGEVAFVLVAGGQGSRLGLPLPKGLLPLGPVSHRTLFEIILSSVHAWRKKTGGVIPVCIMTSPATHAATVEYFARQGNLGFAPGELEIFCQGTMPAIDAVSGKLLLAQKHELALSPDGHGGMLGAMQRHGVLDRLQRRGVKQLFYGQVDNPLLQVCDPLTLGAHLLHGSEMTTQAIRKSDPLQRVGNIVLLDGRVQIIEYSDLPDGVARQLGPDGRLKLWAGSIAVHVFDLAFLARSAGQADALPFHWARKRVAYIGSDGQRVEPGQNNAIKFERFIFDLLPWARAPLVLEIDAADGFAPVKNDAGAATETVQTAQQAMIRRHQRWLRDCGVEIADDVPVEICPQFALDAQELRAKLGGLSAVAAPTFFSGLGEPAPAAAIAAACCQPRTDNSEPGPRKFR